MFTETSATIHPEKLVSDIPAAEKREFKHNEQQYNNGEGGEYTEEDDEKNEDEQYEKKFWEE